MSNIIVLFSNVFRANLMSFFLLIENVQNQIKRRVIFLYTFLFSFISLFNSINFTTMKFKDFHQAGSVYFCF